MALRLLRPSKTVFFNALKKVSAHNSMCIYMNFFPLLLCIHQRIGYLCCAVLHKMKNIWDVLHCDIYVDFRLFQNYSTGAVTNEIQNKSPLQKRQRQDKVSASRVELAHYVRVTIAIASITFWNLTHESNRKLFVWNTRAIYQMHNSGVVMQSLCYQEAESVQNWWHMCAKFSEWLACPSISKLLTSIQTARETMIWNTRLYPLNGMVLRWKVYSNFHGV